MAIEKIQKRYVDDGLGFPVVLRDVPMVKVRGTWTPKINYNRLSRNVALALAEKPARLTGDEIRFLRQHFEMTLEAFGARFDVSHPAVLKWERASSEPPALKWPIEKDIRLFVLDQLKVRPKAFKDLYERLRQTAAARPKPIELSAAQAA